MWTDASEFRGRGGEVGGASPPRSADGVLSHDPPPCNPNPTLFPTTGHLYDPATAGRRLVAGQTAVGRGARRWGPEAHGRVQERALRDGLRGGRWFRPRGVLAVGRRGRRRTPGAAVPGRS